MATIYAIPLQTGAPQTFSVQLKGITYQLTLLYRNDSVSPGWFMDIADLAGDPILQGVPLVTGADLLGQYFYLDFGGGLFVQSNSDPDSPPSFESLGADGQLYWVVNP